MSQTIDNRIVEMQFENKQFESGVQESLSTLDKLKQALKFDDASKNLEDFGKNVSKNIDLSGLTKSVEGLSDKFSVSGIAGMEAIRKLTDFAIEAGKTIAHALDAPFAQIRSGGWKRAMNIEDAKFQLKGLGVAWETVAGDIDYAVADTAYGLDVAAKACAQLSASSVQAGDDMKAALRGISGVAAMGNTEYENISRIFTKAAGNGKVMAMELNQISQYGLNARASLRDFFNNIVEGNEKVENIPENLKKKVMDLTKGMKVSESDINEFVHDSEIDFKTFAYAMDNAFGEHAKKANETFFGALSNIKAALSKIGAEFATPIIKGAIPIFNEIRVFLNELRKHMGPVFEVFKNITELISGKLTSGLYKFRVSLLQFGAIEKIGNALKNVFTSVVKIIVAVKDAFQKVFPPAHNFGRVVDSIADGIENFSKHLILSDGAMYAFRNVMIVVFNIIKALGTVLRNILPIVGKVASAALKVINIIVSLVGYLTTFIMQLDIVKGAMYAIEKAGGLFAFVIDKIRDGFNYLKDVLSDTTTVTGRFFQKLKEVATIAAFIVGGTLYVAFMKIKEVISYFNTKDPLGTLVNSVQTLVAKLKELPLVKTITSGIEMAFGAIGLAISKVIELIKEFVANLKSGMSVAKALGTTLVTIFGGIVTTIGGLIGKVKTIISDLFSAFTKDKIIEETIETPIANAGMALAGMEKTLTKTGSSVKKATTAFEQGRGTLRDYQYQVANTKTGLDKAKDSIIKFGTAILNKIKTIKVGQVLLFSFSTAIILLTINLTKLIKSVTGVTDGISGLLDNFLKAKQRKSTFLEAMLGISLGIASITAALYTMAQIPSDKLQQVVVSLGALLSVIGVFSMLSKNGTSGFAISMASFAGSVLMLVAALYALNAIKTKDMKDLWIRVGILATIMAAMAGISMLISKFSGQFMRGAAAMLGFAGSVYILAKALDIVSHADLQNISSNWQGLTLVILAFAAFASIASNVGMTAALSLIAFLGVLKLLISQAENLKKIFGSLENALKYIADVAKSAIRYIYNGLKQAAEDMKENEMLAKVIGGGFTAIIVSLTAVILALGHAGKGMKKAAVGFAITLAAIAGLMFVTVKIAEFAQTINPSAISDATSLLKTIFGFLSVLALLTSDVTIGKITLKSNENSIKQIRKLLSSMGLLVLAIGAFAAMTGTLTADEMTRVKGLLEEVIILVGIIAGVISIITAVASKGGKSEVTFGTFVGVVLLLGSLIGSIATLMFMFSTIDWEKDKVMLIAVGAAFVAISTAIILILAQIAKIEKAKANQDPKKARKMMLSCAAIIAAIGGLVILLNREFKDSGGWAEAAKYAGILVGCLAAISIMVLSLEAFSKKFLNTELRQKAFDKTLKAVQDMILAIIAFGAIFIGLKALGASTWDMLAQAGVLIGSLAAIVLLVREIQRFSKDSKYTFTKKSSENFSKTMKYIGLAIAAIAGLAFVFAKLSNVDAGRMAGQATTLVATLYALSVLVLGIERFMKKANVKNIMKVEGTIGIMIAAFMALALIFKFIIDNFDSSAGDLLKKSQVIMLALGELSLLVYAIHKFMAEAKIGNILKVEGVLLAMVGIFAVLSLIFKYIISSIPDPTAMLAKSQIIMLALYELAGLVALCGVIAKLGAKIAGGEIALLGMVGIFAILTQVFKVINGFQTEGILAKSQSIILVMTELIALIEVMGLLLEYTGGAFVLGAIAELALWPMILLFDLLTDVFTKIDGMKTEGLLAKSQSIILVMTELVGLIALMGGLVYAAGEFALGGLAELALWPMIILFDLLADVFVKIDGMKTEGLLPKAQAIVLVMTELVGIIALMGILIPLMALGGLAEFALSPMIDLFGQLSQVFLIIDQMHLDDLQEKADIIVDTLLKLEGLSALGGLIGGTVGFGLLVLAEGIEALGTACATVGNGIMVFGQGMDFLTNSIIKLVATGPGIQSWFANISTGVMMLATSVMNTITGLSVSVVASVNILITGIALAIRNGKTIIFKESSGIGDAVKNGIKAKLNPLEWGKELVGKFAQGIKSGIGAVANAAASIAHTVWSYLHFSNGPEIGDIAGKALEYFGFEGAATYAQGWLNGQGNVEEAISGITSMISTSFEGIDLSGVVNVGEIFTGEDDLMGKLNKILQAIGLVKGEIASLNSLGHGTRDDFLYQLQGSARGLEKELDRCNQAATRLSSNGTRSGENAKKKAAEVQKKLNDVNAQITELTTGVKQATPEVKDLGDSLGGLGDGAKKGSKSMKEATDEIANFYDSIEGAISLFQEFNKETELTSDQLLKNMKSQIEGVSEWSTQIQKLAFMGIDQGLLQELAEMGPQGYEYTNAFVHMTAEQLAEANNLYHQSLMLPAKVTSQIYGSYTVAGRSAASGFLMGMNKEDVKEAAVGFAHQVVDGMNLALDIQSGKSMVTYEDGVAVVNGVKTGLNAADMKKQLGTAIDLLTKENIKGGFDKGLFNNNQMYNVGANITKGISDGVKDGEAVGDLKGSIIWVCNEAVNAAKSKKATDEHSPSKVFEKIGKFITLGLASGITSETQAATNAITDTSKSIIDTMRDTINRANQALIDDIDEPVITPILDLSEIQNGSRELDDMLSRNSALSAGSSFTNLQNEQWGAQSALLNATMDNTDVVSAISSLGEEITTLKDAMTSIQLVLDTGTMVGAMTPQIDQQLGMRQVYAGRGI